MRLTAESNKFIYRSRIEYAGEKAAKQMDIVHSEVSEGIYSPLGITRYRKRGMESTSSVHGYPDVRTVVSKGVPFKFELRLVASSPESQPSRM